MSIPLKRLSRVIARELQISEEELDRCFRPAAVDEVVQVSRMRMAWQHFSDLDEDVAYLRWRYFGRERSGGGLWVVCIGDRVLGAVGVEPLQVSTPDGPIEIMSLMDTIIHDEVRGSGLGAWMNLKLQAIFPSLLVVGANENSRSMLDKLFTPLPVLKTYVLITRSRDYLGRHLPIAPLAGLLGKLVDLFTRCHLFFLHLYYRLRHRQLRFAAYESVAELLEALPSGPLLPGCTPDNTLFTARNCDYLQWRFIDNPRNVYKVIAAIDNQRNVAGYVIYTVKRGSVASDNATPETEGHIVDWLVFTPHGNRALLSTLILRATRQLLHKDVERVNILATDADSRKAVQPLGYLLRDTASTFYVEDSEGRDFLYQPDNWHITLADCDRLDMFR